MPNPWIMISPFWKLTLVILMIQIQMFEFSPSATSFCIVEKLELVLNDLKQNPSDGLRVLPGFLYSFINSLFHFLRVFLVDLSFFVLRWGKRDRLRRIQWTIDKYDIVESEWTWEWRWNRADSLEHFFWVLSLCDSFWKEFAKILVLCMRESVSGDCYSSSSSSSSWSPEKVRCLQSIFSLTLVWLVLLSHSISFSLLFPFSISSVPPLLFMFILSYPSSVSLLCLRICLSAWGFQWLSATKKKRT